MLQLYVWVKDLLRNERGQDMVEYALIVAVISIVIVLATMLAIGPAFTTWANGVAGCITNPADCSIPFVSAG